MDLHSILIQSAAASTRTTEAGNLVGFDWELVVVRDLLALLDVSLGINDNLFLPVNSDDLGVAVGLQESIQQNE